MVFDGANHTRFEHSLGTGHLSELLFDTILKNSKGRDNLLFENERDRDMSRILVTVAGLCHDLGHGPFSHMFDNELLPRLGKTDWKHERGSEMLFDSLMENEHLKTISCEELITIYDHRNIVKNLIQGDRISTSLPKWIYQIMSNKTNSIDVDKFDYLSRDSYYCGLKGYDFLSQ